MDLQLLSPSHSHAKPNGGTVISASGFGHPTCVNTGNPAQLPAVR